MGPCHYAGVVHLENTMCWRCSLFLHTCTPIASESGYALGSELDCILCEGCTYPCERIHLTIVNL